MTTARTATRERSRKSVTRNIASTTHGASATLQPRFSMFAADSTGPERAKTSAPAVAAMISPRRARSSNAPAKATAIAIETLRFSPRVSGSTSRRISVGGKSSCSVGSLIAEKPRPDSGFQSGRWPEATVRRIHRMNVRL